MTALTGSLTALAGEGLRAAWFLLIQCVAPIAILRLAVGVEQVADPPGVFHPDRGVFQPLGACGIECLVCVNFDSANRYVARVTRRYSFVSVSCGRLEFEVVATAFDVAVAAPTNQSIYRITVR